MSDHSVSNSGTGSVAHRQRSDRWDALRIWLAGAFGVLLAANGRLLDFLQAGGGFAGLLNFTEILLVPVLFLLIVLGLLVEAGVTLWWRQYRRAASSILAIMAIPVCAVVIARAPLFDPWLWYAVANKGRFEALAIHDPPPNGPKYAKTEVWDLSSGLAVNGNHFAALVYDESDAVALQPSERPIIWQTRTEFGLPLPKGTRLCGHLFKVDWFE